MKVKFTTFLTISIVIAIVCLSSCRSTNPLVTQPNKIEIAANNTPSADETSFTLQIIRREISDDSNATTSVVTFQDDGKVTYKWKYSGYYPGSIIPPVDVSYVLNKEQTTYVIEQIKLYALNSNFTDVHEETSLGHHVDVKLNLNMNGTSYERHLKGMLDVFDKTKIQLVNKDEYIHLEDISNYISGLRPQL